MRGNYAHDIKSKPGTCGGCIHFRRAKNVDYTSAQGNCDVRSKRWIYSQCTKACKKHYKSREEDVYMEENVRKLLSLVKENPNLPIIPMVDSDLCGYEFGIYMGGFGAARVDSYVIDRRDTVLFKSNDDVFDTLERCLSEEEFDTLPEAENECRLIYEALPWKEAVIVNIVIPEEGTE